VTGTVNSSSLFRSGTSTNYVQIGWNSVNNIIQSTNSVLLINYGGQDVAICTGGSGIVKTGKNVEIGSPTTNSAVALNIKTDGTNQTTAFRVDNSSNAKVFSIKSDGTTQIGTQTQTTGAHTDALLTIYGKVVSKSLLQEVTNA